MDFGKTIARAKAILVTPRTEWPIAAAEPASVGSLYAGYIIWIAALPAIATFIKQSLIGTGFLGVVVRMPIATGLGAMVLRYVLSLAVAYVVALIINVLAGTFNGQKDMVQALKTVAYAWTAAWIAGIAVIIPWIGWLIAIAGAVYGIYLLYLGLPFTMKCPSEKAGGYTALTVIIAIVLSWIVSLIVVGVIGTAAYTGAAMTGTHLGSTSGDNVTVDPNSALGRLAAMGERAEQASKEMEAAQKSGDSAAQQAAMGRMMGAAMGNDGSVQALSTEQVKAFLPETLLGLKRTSSSAQRSNAMGMQVTEAHAEYGDGSGRNVTLEVTDMGTAKGLMAMAGAMAPEEERSTDHGYDKTYTAGGRLTHEAWDDQSKSGEYSVVVGQRFTVKAQGGAASIDDLKQAVASVDLGKLESMREEGVTRH
ncbi:Yip1 family protein [Frateuria terrea]|uniref:Yip1 domain-containing protein n=1 Tax=Frateuria terrea TaxID=529704 RepID=A0A1H6WHU3_9GAMM|nr:Yip1 family protein [Frateuria terrea]SEJ16619.1 Yip1 domain-containing protein [Frateuria terrea]SFP55925.1 Yip1 domain-containing protein [Frateuria terrea]